jgi:hypothetical protein
MLNYLDSMGLKPNEFILLVLTLFLVVFQLLLWLATRALVLDARKANERLQRAYLWPGFGQTRSTSENDERIWLLTIHNTGRTAGVIKSIHHALVKEDDFEARRFEYEEFVGRENVIPPDMGERVIGTGISFAVRSESRISCGYVTYKDVFGHTQVQGWKHRLHLEKRSDSLPGCYSDPHPERWAKSKK